MLKNRKVQIEYIFLALIFASVVWGIFAGFRIVRYQWIMIAASVAIFLGICMLCDRYKKSIYVMIFVASLFVVFFHRQLINGFRIINNKMALALNHSMDLGFYYYISVQMEHSRRDSVIAVFFFLLVAGIVLTYLRHRPLLLFILTGMMQCLVLAIAPYSISSAFVLFLGSWIVYFSLRKGKKAFSIFIYTICLICMMPLYFYDQTTVPSDTMIKRNILIKIRKMTQGESYLAVGGIGDGDIGSVGEVSPKGEKLFKVYAPEKDDLYLKSYVSGTYKKGKWINQADDTLVCGGESAIGLDYLFPDLRMDDFVTYDKGYIKTEKDLIFSERRTLKIQYQKKQDQNLLFPYFADTSQMEGSIISDRMIARSSSQKDYDTTYYQIANLKNLLYAKDHLDFSNVKKDKNQIAEQDYIKAVDDHTAFIKKNYLGIPKEIKNYLKTIDYNADEKRSILENVNAVRSYLKKNYEYTYRPGLTLQGKDPVIYFLKDRKKGFCTQYASAAVFLLRNVKIPARYVEGYKVRSDQWDLGCAQVTDYEAHAWVEIYLDHIGWIPIDVTGRNTGKTTYETVEKEEKQRNAIAPNKKQFVTNVKKTLHFIIALCIVCMLLFVIKMLQRKQKLKQMTNKEKVLYYEKQINKYSKEPQKSREIADLKTFEIIEKAKFSQKEIKKEEVIIVKRHLDLLKRRNKNITKILTKMK